MLFAMDALAQVLTTARLAMTRLLFWRMEPARNKSATRPALIALDQELETALDAVPIKT